MGREWPEKKFERDRRVNKFTLFPAEREEIRGKAQKKKRIA